MKRRDLYEVLGVARSASGDQIKTAYKRLAREHHPDLNPDDPASEEKFKELAFAKDVLLDDEKKHAYDEFGFDGLEAGFDPEQSRAYREWSARAERTRGASSFSYEPNLEDLLGQMFGEGSRRANAPRRGADAETELTIDFLVAVNGGEQPLRLQGYPEMRVTVPPGARDGTRLRLKGKGMQPTEDTEPGDLFVRLRVRAHPFFEREGDHLHLDLPATIPELLLGAEVSVPTPTGSVAMKIPRRSANGQKLRLKGKGVPAHGKGGKAGDLFVRLVVVLPGSGSSDADTLDGLAEDLKSHYADVDVRAQLAGGAA